MNGYTFERRELKYRITDAQRAALEAAFGTQMIPDEYGESTICNIYYDTADYRLIRASLEKPAYKEKLRLRSYGVTEPGGEVFLELKKKYKGIVYKRRITLPEDAAGEFIAGRARSVNTPPKQPTAAAENRCGCWLSKKSRRVCARRRKYSSKHFCFSARKRAGVSECAAASRSPFKRESNAVGLV